MSGLEFYKISCQALPRYYYAMPPSDVDWLSLAAKGPGRGRKIRYNVDINNGRHRGHVLFLLAWSSELIEVLDRCKATGYKVYNIEVIDSRTDSPIDGYQGISVHGRGGEFDPIRSRATFYEDGDIKQHEAIYMNDSNWDGSDVFLMPGLGMSIFVTPKIAVEMNKLKLKNVSITRNSECSYPWEP